MAQIEENQVKELLGEKIEDLWEIVNGGWSDYLKLYPDSAKLLHSSGTRASIVHDHQIARASQYALKNQVFGAALVNLSKMQVLLIDQKFAIRFKKLDSGKKSSNQPTNQVIKFQSQDQLDGLPETFNLEAGYVLSKDEKEVSEIYLVCPNGSKKNFWAMRLEKGEATTLVSDLFVVNSNLDVEEAEIAPKKEDTNIIQLDKAKGKDEN